MLRSPILVGALLAALLLPHPTAARGKDPEISRSWTSPELASRVLRSIVVLPAATWDGNPEASTVPPNAWLGAAGGTGYRWIPASEVLAHFSANPQANDSLLKSIRAQVRRSGVVDATTAGRLGRAFGAEGVLCFRVDRWDAALGAGSRYTAIVDMRCALVDTAGTELWYVEGRFLNDGPVVQGPVVAPAPQQPLVPVATPSLSSSSQAGGGSSSAGGSGGGGSSAGGGSGGSSSGGGSSSSAAASSSNSYRQSSAAKEPTLESRVREGDEVDPAPLLQAAVDSLVSRWVLRFPPRTGSAKSSTGAKRD